ncbi:SRPBCC family protein [Actinoplanes sp. NPDC051513]|uniref:SRPBCC family protein n=1 Tax=Actinoplanes sp. NPDC051513 TaxID=3363908 RepID=UPI0037B21310
MKITNEFTVHTPIERAWELLTDLQGIAPCMPGAQLTGVDGDTYRGKVKVKVGPVISEFAGTARFAEKDDAAYRAVIDAKGKDARSAGNASALVTAVLTPAGSSTAVSVDTDLKISGKLAQFGSGMIKEVSGKLLAQFVSNLEAKLAAEEAAPASPAESPADTDAAAGSLAGADASAKTAASEAVTQKTAEDAVPPASASPVPTQAAPAPSAPATPAAVAPETAPAAGPVAAGSDSTPAAASQASTAASPAVASPAASPVASPVASPAANPAAFSPSSADEPEPLDLLSVAGSSIYKRAIPLVIGLVVVGAVIAWAIARR